RRAAATRLDAALAGELAPYNIRVNAYIPGLTSTDITRPVIEKNRQHFQSQIALNRIAEPEDIAGSIVFLASDAARYMTGAFIESSGGKFCVQNPNAAWQNAAKP
ncbi:MAG: SDR family oxidoreductase, partial [Candidatus Taylorbacteria bacterium]